MGRNTKIDASIGGYLSTRKRSLRGNGSTASTTYDLLLFEVTADKRRHRRKFSLGTLKESPHEADIIRFWGTAFFRMKLYGLDEHQRRHVASEMVRKGARPPSS
jgi:hypothetical protein